ncbi:hypothetical protein, partial [[Clostridium] innocuum]|uniref:hypothetical protein n=1 Tax=Clostridium innocuum TaxID=1522 RepID=UPI0005D1D819
MYHVEGTPLSTSEGVGTTSSHVEGTQDGTQFTHNVFDAPRIIKYRKPKYLIDIDTNILQAMPDKIPKRTCQRNANRIWRSFFENLNMTGRCQLFVEMMRNLKFRPIMKILGLRTMDESS